MLVNCITYALNKPFIVKKESKIALLGLSKNVFEQLT